MDFSEIMKQASKIQDQMKSAKEELKNIELKELQVGICKGNHQRRS
ncbi:MAG: hypothetical protein CM15mP73_2290 [Hyphomicrobiales bacterium]|nr:MAG: hypothetical protein CM15mP73_2290 [Hyphomicrobiales bacterium]